MEIKTFFQNLIPWFLSHGIKIVSIIIVAYLTSLFLRIFVGKIIKKQVKNGMNGRKGKRAETLISIFVGTSSFIIWIIVLLMVLSEFGINIAPILAGVGVMGLAVGMAARDIVSDFIAGLFILLEEQYHVGDKVKVANIEGVVKEITLRRTTLQDESGTLHCIPNSQVKIVSKTP